MERCGSSRIRRKEQVKIEDRRVGFVKQVLYGNSVSAVVRIVLGVLMLFSGWFKVLDPEGFSAVIVQYDLMPAAWASWPALVLPVVECMIGLFLLFGFRIRAASLLAALMMLFFTGAIAINLARGNIFDCGCFELNRLGIGIDETLSPLLIVRDLVLCGAFMLVFFVKRHIFSFEAMREQMHLENIE